MEKKKFSLWTLFSSTFMLSAFTFGGGYVIVPLMKKKFADELGWLSEDETLELVAIGQSSPGAIAINSAVLLGWRCGGLPGALVGALGTAIPPLIILSVMYLIYDFVRDNVYAAALLRGMQSGIAAVIIDAVWSMAKGYFKSPVKVPSIAVMACAFCATWFFNINVAYIILAAGLFGAIAAAMSKKREGSL
ncbi:MAG: chromate transporter [Candidatus Heteroscillospira sp.]